MMDAINQQQTQVESSLDALPQVIKNEQNQSICLDDENTESSDNSDDDFDAHKFLPTEQQASKNWHKKQTDDTTNHRHITRGCSPLKGDTDARVSYGEMLHQGEITPAVTYLSHHAVMQNCSELNARGEYTHDSNASKQSHSPRHTNRHNSTVHKEVVELKTAAIDKHSNDSGFEIAAMKNVARPAPPLVESAKEVGAVNDEESNGRLENHCHDEPTNEVIKVGDSNDSVYVNQNDFHLRCGEAMKADSRVNDQDKELQIDESSRHSKGSVENFKHSAAASANHLDSGSPIVDLFHPANVSKSGYVTQDSDTHNSNALASPSQRSTANEQIVKMNGDHKLLAHETDDSNHDNVHSCAQTIQTPTTQGGDITAGAYNEVMDDADDEVTNDGLRIVEESEHEEEKAKIEVTAHEHNANIVVVPVNTQLVSAVYKDEDSCSSLCSNASNSTGTTSSHQLVIDHPMDDLETASESVTNSDSVEQPPASDPIKSTEQTAVPDSTKSCNQPVVKDGVSSVEQPVVQKLAKSSGKKMVVAKEDDRRVENIAEYLSLKRKISNDKKSPHLPKKANLLATDKKKTKPVKRINERGTASSVAKSKGAKTQERLEKEVVSKTKVPKKVKPLKSILLDQLKKPQRSPPKHISFNQNDKVQRPSLTAPQSNDTKYFCVKCKTKSFDSAAALKKHQVTCFVSKKVDAHLKANTSSPKKKLQIKSEKCEKPLKSEKFLKPDKTVKALNSARSQQSAKPQQSTKVKSVKTSTSTPKEKEEYFKCSTCGTIHNGWNLFLHVKERHNRHVCLHCLRFFPTAEKLSLHLELKHDLEQIHYSTEESFRKTLKLKHGCVQNGHFLLCCSCQHVFRLSEPFSDHNCSQYIKPCALCGQTGRHTNQCNAHPDALKASKRTKRLDAISTKSDAQPAPALINRPQISISLPQILPTSSFCDKYSSQRAKATAPTFPFPFPDITHSDESSNSDTMIIDEACQVTYSDGPESLLKRSNEHKPKMDLPPDKPVLEKLVVPKLKLRVPKEFQKSVDAALSSTDSDDDEDDETFDIGNKLTGRTGEEKCTIRRESQVDLDVNSLTESAIGYTLAQDTVTESNSEAPKTDGEDDSLDGRNSNLSRIMEEIERTKLDIERTKKAKSIQKESFLLAPKSIEPTPPPQPQPQLQPQPLLLPQPQPPSPQPNTNWSPTPPASPNSHIFTPRRNATECPDSSEQIPEQQEHTSHTHERRPTTGSDIMDIDDTVATTEKSELEESDESKLNGPSCEESVAAMTKSPINVDMVNSIMENPEMLQNEVDQIRSEAIQEKSLSMPSEAEKSAPLSDIVVNVEHSEPIDRDIHSPEKESLEPEKLKPADGIEVANEDTMAVDLQLDRPLEKFEVVDFVRICLRAVYSICLYCNHARRIAVNGKSLVLHLIAQHRFTATVDSITAEELKSDTIVAKLKTFLPILEDEFFNLTSYCTMGDGKLATQFNERIFECFQCRFVASTHKELYLHNRKMHLRTAILCFMCRANFYSFSEILCHVCPGAPNKSSVFDVKFRCCLCSTDNIPSPFRLMVHLRKSHFTCDICLEDCRDQSKLSSHVWKHKLHHLCYRCGIAYRNKMDITKHLFWKHGTESINCKRCVQKRWRHVYHFCVPPSNFTCDVCSLVFLKAVHLKVHKRIHSGDFRYPCTEENCQEKFISRRLLLKHTPSHQLLPALPEAVEKNETSTEVEEQAEPLATEVKTEVSDSLEKEVKVTDVKAEELITESKLEEEPNIKTINSEDGTGESRRKKRKKNKRSKESLEDLNLIAPNLSESDSSGDSDTESKSKGDDDSLLVPKVMLSPPSENETEKDPEKSAVKPDGNIVDSEMVMEIWQNFFGTQQNAGQTTELPLVANYTEDNYPTPTMLHVLFSDHDYCRMYQPLKSSTPARLQKPGICIETPESSPIKRKSSKSPRQSSARHSDGSSSSSDSSSSSGSSCSCGSNCSCSSSDTDSSSSSSSSADSDSSMASKSSSQRRKHHRKKSERDRTRKKSVSISPLKKHNSASEMVNVDVDVDGNTNDAFDATLRLPSPPKEPMFRESDLETAESETDEEFYDEHPQKLATELLAQKRAQLMAQTRLSPSHNYDIVENSRPSTPSLPEDVLYEKKVKFKKKKRDRKTSKMENGASVSAVAHPNFNYDIGKAPALIADQMTASHQPQNVVIGTLQKPMIAHCTETYVTSSTMSPMITETTIMQQSLDTVPHIGASVLGANAQLPPHVNAAVYLQGRMSEGSSCSDADGSLKRSKRTRRPNKFYGYTSDDENMASGLGRQPLMIGMRAFKPQPPPQLTWRKEDLPTPSKSILNNKNKSARTPKTPTSNLLNALGQINSDEPGPSRKRKRPPSDKLTRKRPSKKNLVDTNMPPIPTLKIRPMELGIKHTSEKPNHIPASLGYSSQKETDTDTTEVSSDDEGTPELGPPPSQFLNTTTASTAPTTNLASVWNASMGVPTRPMKPPETIAAQAALPSQPPSLPPTPQTTVFNHKIPPALLPNPDFGTLQYFKANNIRYPIRPPAGARKPREGESVYCYCRCPYDEVSEMIACDGENCLIEWFHFECVGIMVAPVGKWFCAECRPQYSEELYPQATTNA